MHPSMWFAQVMVLVHKALYPTRKYHFLIVTILVWKDYEVDGFSGQITASLIFCKAILCTNTLISLMNHAIPTVQSTEGSVLVV